MGKVKQKVRKKVEELAAALYNCTKSGIGSKASLSLATTFSCTSFHRRSVRRDRGPDTLDSGSHGGHAEAAPDGPPRYGDVGFGKTEIAIRAAFKASLDKKQDRFARADDHPRAPARRDVSGERLSRFPVVVEVISRFNRPRSRKES